LSRQETFKKLGRVTVSGGGEVENYSGTARKAGISRRTPLFLKLGASENPHLNFNTGLSVEKVEFRNDSLKLNYAEKRGAVRGMISLNYPSHSASFTGLAGVGENNFLETAFEGRAASSFGRTAEVELNFRDAVEEGGEPPGA